MPIGIAFVAHAAYGALIGGRDGHMGGIERQISLMSRWLAARGHRVSVLTWDEGQGSEVTIDGVRIISLGLKRAGLPGLRFFAPRWTMLLAALRRADADIYYQNGAECVTGQVALWCRQNARRFVYSVASDMDVLGQLPELPAFHQRWLYRQGLRLSDSIVVQTEAQRCLLQANFHLPGRQLAMPCPGPEATSAPRAAPRSPRVLWAARIAPVKRLELLLEVAWALPHVGFDVAGHADADQRYTDPLIREARLLPNVILHGAVPREQMPQLYAHASLLCCTSLVEGFPNTFIEAWSHGVPVVSTVDPDGLLQRNGLGAAAVTAAGLSAAINTLLNDTALWQHASIAARKYYLSHHAVDTAMLQFESLIVETLAGTQTR
jgi:glycosyltransferase involved in cell wall biosynthesis